MNSIIQTLYDGIAWTIVFINKYLNILTINSKEYNYAIIVTFSIAIGYLLKTKIKNNQNNPFYWILFSIFIFIILSYIGIAN